MAKKKLLKTKANFTLRRLHQSGSYGNIYERDYTTVAKFPSNNGDQISIYTGPHFKLTVNSSLNGQKKYQYGDWLTNPNSCSDQTNLWTLGCLPTSNKIDSKIVLKPNSHKLTDFACYGSAHELIRATLTNIVAKFPAEIYVSDQKLVDTNIFNIDENMLSSKMYEYKDWYIVDNPFNIDLLQRVIPESSQVTPLRYMCESEYNYVVLDENGDIIANGNDLKEWNEANSNNNQLKHFYITTLTPDKKCIVNGDLLGETEFYGLNLNNSVLKIACFNYENKLFYLANNAQYRVRPNVYLINKFFEDLDDFSQVLLNQYTDYTAIFDTYEETKDDGWQVYEKKYKWPVGEGNWNLSINGIGYSNYINDLTKLATNYDLLYTNAIWRDMVHESISNMDLTMISNGEEENIDSSKMKQLLNIAGRQFDEIKKYIDNIKYVNKITYTQDNNTPDYFLSDNIELSGWEPKEILNEIPDDEITEPMYGARTIGFSASDANSEFMRRLQLNSKQILAEKGTKKCIEDLMALFGYHSTDWLRRYYGKLDEKYLRRAFVMIEYVYVADGYAFDENPDTVYSQVRYLNSIKDNFEDDDIENDNFDPYKGLPVVEVNYDGVTRLVPWFDKEYEYDSKLYFQMKGGWARNEGNATNDPHVYDYTISKIHYVSTLDDLYSLLYYALDEHGVYYVGNTQTYHRLKDIDKYDTPDGWETPSDEEIAQIESIIDNNKGNNPHTGNYDGGAEFYETLGELFKKSKFDNVRDDKTQFKFNYGFNINRQADSTKCLYFNSMTDLEGDASALRGENRIKPYNFFGGGEYDEPASLSVINSKELHIIFDDAQDNSAFRKFLEKDVLPYIKQIIPSTTIFSYSFEHLTGDDDKLYEARTHKVVCNGETCSIYGVVE